MSDCRKCAEFDWCVENEDCGMFKPKPQTNADRIRAMTDEELAGCLFEFEQDAAIIGVTPYSRLLAWLKQEVKE